MFDIRKKVLDMKRQETRDFPPPTGNAVRDGLNSLNARMDRSRARRGLDDSEDDKIGETPST